ncbi:hypothetical protein ACEQPO_27185 [Bacillus sp. SL00103]
MKRRKTRQSEQAIAVSKENEQLIKEINDAIDALKRTEHSNKLARNTLMKISRSNKIKTTIVRLFRRTFFKWR